MICANRFARIALRIARATKPPTWALTGLHPADHCCGAWLSLFPWLLWEQLALWERKHSTLVSTLSQALPGSTHTCVANPSALYRGQKPQNREKRGFRSRKTPISPHPRKGCFESKNPHFYTRHHKENGGFLTRNAHFWGGGKWGFFDSETLFSRFWGFWPLYRADGFATQTLIPSICSMWGDQEEPLDCDPRALRARNRKKVSKRGVFLGVRRKVSKNTRKSLKIPIFGPFWVFFRYF